MKWNSAEIAAATAGQEVAMGCTGSIVTDTRKLQPGTWFLALRGANFDGHLFIDEAASKGACGVIVDTLPSQWSGGIIKVRDTTIALQDLGRAARQRISGPIIGITGSAGKTTTRAFVALALSSLGPIHQTFGNLNNHLGVPMTLLVSPEEAAATVIEMGTSSPGEIQFLAQLVRPTIRLITNIGAAHLEELGGLEGVAAEKGALFETAAADDLIILNRDDPFLEAWTPRLQERGIRVLGFGYHQQADFRIMSATIDLETLSTGVAISTPEGKLTLRLPMPGIHFAQNAAAALAIAHGLGVLLPQAIQSLEGYEPIGMRMRVESLFDGITVFNDSYNANPTSVEASLRMLASLPGRRVAVLGDMLELGSSESVWHQKIVSLAGELGIHLVVLIGPRMAAAVEACQAPEVWVETHQTAADRLRSWLSAGDQVLFKGSRGAQVELILQKLQHFASVETH